MKVINLLFMLLAIVSVSISVQAIEVKDVRTAKFISCNNLTQQQISAKVKNDFIQIRLPSWEEDKKLLGPKVVVWINNSITPIKDGYKIPLIVRGARKDINYQVIVDCQNGSITYQVNGH